MANVLPNENFKEELLYLLKSAIDKLNENSNEIAFLRKEIDKNTRALKNLKKEIRSNSGFYNDDRFRIIEMFNRLFEVEKPIKSCADRFSILEAERNRTFTELLKLTEDIEENPDAKIQLNELNVWLENLEEEVFA